MYTSLSMHCSLRTKESDEYEIEKLPWGSGEVRTVEARALAYGCNSIRETVSQ